MPARARSTVCLRRMRPALVAGLLTGCAGAAAAAPLDMLYAPAASAANTVLDTRIVGYAVILGGLSLAVILLAFGHVLSRRRMSGKIAAQRAEISGLRSALDRNEALLETQDQLNIVYKNEGTVVHGGLPGVADLPPSTGEATNFRRWLATDSVVSLDKLLAGLTERGESFHTVVNTVSGLHLEALGRTAAGTAVLILRNVSGDRLHQIHLNERCAEQERELSALRALVAASPLPAWTRAADGRLACVNAAYAAAVGAEGEEEARESELFDERARLAIQRAVSGGQDFHGHLTAGERTYEVVATRMAGAQTGLALDITAVEEVRSVLNRHVEAHVRTLDRLATAVAIFGPDRALRFCNTAYGNLWQLDRAWLASAPAEGEILDALRGAGLLPEQADYRSWKRAQLRMSTDGEANEQLWHLPDGRMLRVLGEPHPDGSLTYLYDDVTEQMELRSRHKALEDVQRETLDNLAEGVALFASNGRLRFYNAAFARMWRLSAGQLDDKPHIDNIIAWSRVLMDDPEAWAALKARVTSLDTREPGTFRFERPNGSVIDCLTVPLPGGDTLITHRDVTDAALAERALRERNEALEQTDRVKTAFVRHVSYVLRAPLTTITGYADLLARPATGDLSDKQREYTGHILASSHALLAIINDILDLATIDAGIMELEHGAVDMAAVLRTAAHGLGDQLREAGVSLDIAEVGDVGTFIADGKRITQILFNLIANAIAHSPPGGRVRVACAREGDEVILSVADQGPGIAPELGDTIFERFESHAADGGQRGAGLGLAIVRSLVGLHGGEVRYVSSPGRGTTFTCLFPISPDVAARRRARRAQTDGRADEARSDAAPEPRPAADAG